MLTTPSDELRHFYQGFKDQAQFNREAFLKDRRKKSLLTRAEVLEEAAAQVISVFIRLDLPLPTTTEDTSVHQTGNEGTGQ